jgi:hypothetical protein
MKKSKFQVDYNSNNATSTLKNNKFTYFYKLPYGHRKQTLVVRDNSSKEEVVLHGNDIRGLMSVLDSNNSKMVSRDYKNASLDYFDGRSAKKGSYLRIMNDESLLELNGRDINSLVRVVSEVA